MKKNIKEKLSFNVISFFLESFDKLILLADGTLRHFVKVISDEQNHHLDKINVHEEIPDEENWLSNDYEQNQYCIDRVCNVIRMFKLRIQLIHQFYLQLLICRPFLLRTTHMSRDYLPIFVSINEK